MSASALPAEALLGATPRLRGDAAVDASRAVRHSQRWSARAGGRSLPGVVVSIGMRWSGYVVVPLVCGCSGSGSTPPATSSSTAPSTVDVPAPVADVADEPPADEPPADEPTSVAPAEHASASAPPEVDGSGPDYDLFRDAQDAMQASDRPKARKLLLSLIQRHPKSKLIPRAYLTFGEMFFEDAASDPAKWQLAQSSYEQVTKYPPPHNPVYQYAHYKLGWVHTNSGNNARALKHFSDVISFSAKYPAAPNAASLASAARRDLVPVYAKAGAPTKAYAFFKLLSGDVGSSQRGTLKMLANLAQVYADGGKWREAVAIYAELIKRDPTSACGYQRSLVLAKDAAGQASAADRAREMQLCGKR